MRGEMKRNDVFLDAASTFIFILTRDKQMCMCRYTFRIVIVGKEGESEILGFLHKLAIIINFVSLFEEMLRS